MRRSILVVSLLALPLPLSLAACTSDSSTEPPAEEPAFTIVSSDVTLAPGEEVTKCFYFHTPNTTNLHIHKWVSDMTAGSHHMIYFSSIGSQPADGIVDDCEGAGTPLPVYGAQTAHQEADFPTDDVGVQLAQVVVPQSAGYLQMHYLNTTDAPLTAHVELAAYALADDKTFTRTDLFGTYNADISIPPHATGLQGQRDLRRRRGREVLVDVDALAQAGRRDRGQGRRDDAVLEHRLGAPRLAGVPRARVLHVQRPDHVGVHLRQHR